MDSILKEVSEVAAFIGIAVIWEILICVRYKFSDWSRRESYLLDNVCMIIVLYLFR